MSTGRTLEGPPSPRAAFLMSTHAYHHLDVRAAGLRQTNSVPSHPAAERNHTGRFIELNRLYSTLLLLPTEN